MELIAQPAETLARMRDARRRGARISLVPTMGALHAGHAALISAARAESDEVVLSIFVNPLQFNRLEDLEKYPRDLDNDLASAEELGVDIAFVPSPHAMYPDSAPVVQVDPGALADHYEGAARPGHFRGVATVVTKLLSIVEPDAAYFGEKDYQQLVIVRRLVADLSIPTAIVAIATVRESDGLALSSRNRRLTGDERLAASVLHRGLLDGARALRGGASPESAARVVRETVITEPLARLDYAAATDDQLAPADSGSSGEVRLLVAADFGSVRLIDNLGVSQ